VTLSLDGGADIVLTAADLNVGLLAPGRSRRARMIFNVDDDLGAGTYGLAMQLHPAALLASPDPANHTLVLAEGVTVNPARIVGGGGASDMNYPDLRVTAEMPRQLPAGQLAYISNTVTNTGGVAAGGSTVRVYLSANRTVDNDDFILGSWSVPALAPGQSATNVTRLYMNQVMWPFAFKQRFRLLFIVDFGEAVNEGVRGEANNQFTGSFLIYNPQLW
jgi:hypothetical protein